NVSGGPKLNELFAVDVTIKNTGKTPAKNATIRTSYEPVAKGSKVSFKSGVLQVEPSRAMIPPNSISHSSPPIPPQPIQQIDLDRIKSEVVQVYVHGKAH